MHTDKSQSTTPNTWVLLNADGGVVEHFNQAESLFRTAELALCAANGDELAPSDLQDIQRAISVARQKLNTGIEQLQEITNAA